MADVIALATPGSNLPALPVWFEVVWMTLNCLFGAAVTRNRQIPVFGTLFLGVVVGLGGGMTRDVLLGLEPAAISVPYYLPAGIIGAFVGALVFRRIVTWTLPIVVLQGVTLGFLVAIGTQKAMAYEAPWFSAIALGVVTASFGGMVADVMTGNQASITMQAHAQWIGWSLLSGAVVYWCVQTLGTDQRPDAAQAVLWTATLAALVVTTAVRTLSAIRGWPCLSWPGERVEPA